MNTAEVLKPLLAHLEPFYGDTTNGTCGYIASAVELYIIEGSRPKELHSYRMVDVQVLFDGNPELTLIGHTKPVPTVTWGKSVTFAKAARGLWTPVEGCDAIESLTAPKHAVVLCKMVDGTFAILDGNEGQFAHIEGECTIHVQASDLEMKGANISSP